MTRTINVLNCMALIAVMSASALARAQAPESSLEAKLKALYPNTQISSVAGTALPGVFEVVLGRNIAYTDASGQYFLFGHLFEITAQRDITAERLNTLQHIDFVSLPLADAIKTVRGDGSRVLAVFSDPDCPYCKALEPALAQLDNVTVYTFLMPLAQLHPNARSKAVAVWCAADRVKSWQALMLKGISPPSRSCPNPVDRNVALGERLQVNGTPTLVAADGRIMAGAASREQLEAWLSNRQTQATRPAP